MHAFSLFFRLRGGVPAEHEGLTDAAALAGELEEPPVVHDAVCFASIFLKQFLHYFSAAWAAGFQQELHHMTAQTRTGTGPPCLYIPET